jgi:hypothetical protein
VPDRFVKRAQTLVRNAGLQLPVDPISSLPKPPAVAVPISGETDAKPDTNQPEKAV